MTTTTTDLDWTQGRVRYELEDDAAAFDPGSRSTPDTEAALADRSPGGLGIHLVRTLAARLLIERTCTPSELVLVTFTRAAAAEIRGRIRDRLVAIEGDLAQPDTALAHARATRDNDNVSLLYQAQMENRSELLAGVRDASKGNKRFGFQ